MSASGDPLLPASPTAFAPAGVARRVADAASPSPPPSAPPELYVAPATPEGVFNPYPFWGVTDAWPRGFPLSLVNEITTKVGVAHAPVMTDGVVQPRTCVLQSLANVDPDLDLVYRFSHQPPLFMPPRGARLQYPPGVYGTSNAQATLLTVELAAALVLPAAVHSRAADVWRSYVMQRVMWDGGCRLAFADPWVRRYNKNQHGGGIGDIGDIGGLAARGYVHELHAALEIYHQSEVVRQVLNGIDFGGETALGARVLRAFTELYEHELVEEADVKLVYAYLRDLGLIAAARAGQQPPPPSPPRGASPAPGGGAATSGGGGNRAVVCLTGKFRGGPFTLPLLRENVLAALKMPYDIVVVTPAAPAPQQVAAVLAAAATANPGTAGVSEDSFDVAALLYMIPNLAAVVHPDYSNVEAMAALPGWGHTGLTPDSYHNPKKFLSQLTDLATCVEAIRQAGGTYTHALRVRADAVVMDRLPVPPGEVAPRHIVVPNNEDYGGINDRFSYGRLEDMQQMFGLLQALPGLLAQAMGWNAETFLKRYGEALGITFQWEPVQMCRFRRFRSAVLTMDHHDATQYQVCSQYCQRLGAGCVLGERRRRRLEEGQDYEEVYDEGYE